MTNNMNKDKTTRTVETIPVTRKWLETLLALSEECSKAQDEWFETEKPLMPSCFSKLIGCSSSAKTYLSLNHKTLVWFTQMPYEE